MATLVQLKKQKSELRATIDKRMKFFGWCDTKTLLKYKALVERLKSAEDKLLVGDSNY